MTAPRPGQSRPRCWRCHGEVRPVPPQQGCAQRWEHIQEPADGHLADYSLGGILPLEHRPSGKAEMARSADRDLFSHAPEGYPGTRAKVLPEDWEYS